MDVEKKLTMSLDDLIKVQRKEPKPANAGGNSDGKQQGQGKNRQGGRNRKGGRGGKQGGKDKSGDVVMKDGGSGKQNIDRRRRLKEKRGKGFTRRIRSDDNAMQLDGPSAGSRSGGNSNRGGNDRRDRRTGRDSRDRVRRTTGGGISKDRDRSGRGGRRDRDRDNGVRLQSRKERDNDLRNRERTKVVVENVPPRMEWQDLKDVFNKVARVDHCDVISSKGLAYLRFATQREAQRVIDAYDGGALNDRRIRVKFA